MDPVLSYFLGIVTGCVGSTAAFVVFFIWIAQRESKVRDDPTAAPRDTDSEDSINQQIYLDPEAIRDSRLSADDIRLGPLIGVGSYGRVYRAYYRGRDVAVKIIDGSSTYEADICQSISHENLVKIIKTTVTGSTMSSESCEAGDRYIVRTTIVMEYCDIGTLSVLFDNVQKITHHTLLHLAMDIAKGMDYLHKLQIVHGDLKCENVLLVRNMERSCGMTAKVSDFSLSKQLADEQMYAKTRSLGTLTHLAPEVISMGSVGYASDVYSYGVILWELSTRKRPWHNSRPFEIVQFVMDGQRPPSMTNECILGERFALLIEACWTQSAHARPTFTYILSELTAIMESMGEEEHVSVMVQDL